MFIKVKERYINLDNVSLINFVEDKLKISFNFNYGVIKKYGKTFKKISDFHAFFASSTEEYDNVVKQIFEATKSPEWFFINNSNGISKFVNLTNVTSIYPDWSMTRLIFNLNHEVDMNGYDSHGRTIGDYIYIDYSNPTEMDIDLERLEEQLKRL